jgi:hypothetical protein
MYSPVPAWVNNGRRADEVPHQFEIGMLQDRPQRGRSDIAGTALHDLVDHDYLRPR